MNRMILFAVIMLMAASSYSQTYLKPFAGLSQTGISGDVIYPPFWPAPIVENIPAVNYGVNIGTHLKNLRLETGINFLPVGTKVTHFMLRGPQSAQYPYGNITDTVAITNRLTYLSIPISAGYRLNITKHLHVTPQIAIIPGLFFMGYAHLEENNKEVADNHFFFKHGVYKMINVFGNAQLNLEYDITKKIAVQVGPVYSRMLLKAHGQEIANSSNVTFWTASANIGIMVKL